MLEAVSQFPGGTVPVLPDWNVHIRGNIRNIPPCITQTDKGPATTRASSDIFHAE